MALLMTADDIDVRALGKRLLLRRVDLGLDQDDVAERAGLSRAYVSRVERGAVANPKLGDLRRVATALELSLDDLLNEPPPGSRQQSQGDDPELATLMRDLKQAKPEELQWLRDALRLIRRETS